MKATLIVQSAPIWNAMLNDVISKELPHLAESIIYTTTFDEALELIPLDKELVVITSNRFHDKINHVNRISEKIPDCEKCGNKLAQMIKEINPKAKVYLYSAPPPPESDKTYLDGVIEKNEHEQNDFSELFDILKN